MALQLENAPDLSDAESIIATLKRVNFSDTFFGPIRFKPSGELDSTGICQQLMPFPDPMVPVDSTRRRDLQVVWPEAIKSAEGIYPQQYDRPPPPKLSKGQKLTVILCVTIIGTALLIGLALAVVFFLKYKYHWIFIPRDAANDEWGKE